VQGGKMAKILIIDDVAGVRLTVRAVLEAEGYEVLEADNVQKGLDVLMQEGPFELVITDIMMPEVIGTEIIKRVKDTDSSALVMAISGGGKGVSADEALELAQKHADYLLYKPFTNDALKAAVQDLLK
jgi:DNA-binding NtrC family response regulator